MKMLKKVLVALVATILVVGFVHGAPAPDPKPEPNPEPNPVANPLPNPEANPEPNPVPNPEPNPVANPLPKPDPIPHPAPAAEFVAEAEPTLDVLTVPRSAPLDTMGPWKLSGAAADSAPDPQPLELYEGSPFGAGPYLRTIDLKRADEEPLLGIVGALENANLFN